MILLVDDEAESRRMAPFVHALKTAGFELRCAASIAQVLESKEEYSAGISLIILDSMMFPDAPLSNQETQSGLTTGIALLRMMAERWAKIPLIVFTNYNTKLIESQLTTHQAPVTILAKTQVLPNQLVEEVRRVRSELDHGTP